MTSHVSTSSTIGISTTVQHRPITPTEKSTDEGSVRAIVTLQSAIRAHLEQGELSQKKQAVLTLQSAIHVNLTGLENRKNCAPYFFRTLEDLETVENGYGEYVVFRTASGDECGKPIDMATYEQVYSVLHSPIREKGNRYKFIHKKVKKINRSLDIAFIPRTLGELAFIEAGIKEEMAMRGICTLLYSEGRKKFECALKEKEVPAWVQSKLEKCWHLTYFDDEHPADINHPHVKLLAWRLNNHLVKKFVLTGCLSGTEITFFTQDAIRFYTNHAKQFAKKGHAKLIERGMYDPNLGPTLNFGLNRDDQGHKIRSYNMAISNKNAKIIENSVGLECSSLAHNKTILYRAFEHGYVRIVKDESIYNTSLSYGKSLLSGALFDGGATVLHYGTDKSLTSPGRPIYALPISPKDYRNHDSIFYVPETSTLCDDTSGGDFFHARSRCVSVSAETEFLWGVSITNSKLNSRLQELSCSLEPTAFLSGLNKHHVKLIHLTKPF